MKILIAGASGAIGRPLVHRLSANQHEVLRFRDRPVRRDWGKLTPSRSSPTRSMPVQ
jgi:nucleoside-diphosphate-sugar epimerase